MEEQKFDLENFPTSESALRMLSYVTHGFYDKSYVGKWLYQVMGTEYDSARKMAEELKYQMFPETATWGLMYHEMKWQMPVHDNLPYDERRKLIFQKRDYRAPMVPYRMEEYLKNATGFEVHISDVHDTGKYGFVPTHPNIFKVYFIGEETLDIKSVRKMLNQIKQSHTVFKVNDRIETELDNRNLEYFFLRCVKFRLSISFWGCFVFDGKWMLNGMVALNQKRRYSMVLQLKSHMSIFPLVCYVNAVLWAFRAKLCNDEAICIKETNRYEIIIPQNMGNAEMVLYTDIISCGGTLENVTVLTKSVDYWLFDGTVRFDGSRNFDSIYRKESVEE